LPQSLKQPPFVVAMPTETVYGLAARIDWPQGIEAIFKIKRRPFFDPLIVHVSSVKQAQQLTTDWLPAVDILAKALWPGPITFVLPKSDLVDPMITSGLDSVGVRMPRHPMALALIDREGVPLAAPSANLFGRTSPTSAAHVYSEFGTQVPVIDGGECQIGLESTVLKVMSKQDVTELSILRPGAISKSEIEAVLKKESMAYRFVDTIERSLAPGQMKHHYMPSAPLILVRTPGLARAQVIEIVKKQLDSLPESIDGVQLIRPKGFEKIFDLEMSSDPTLAARTFYGNLRKVAEQNPDLILFQVQSFHRGEQWQALFDRLTKASSIIV